MTQVKQYRPNKTGDNLTFTMVTIHFHNDNLTGITITKYPGYVRQGNVRSIKNGSQRVEGGHDVLRVASPEATAC